MSGVKSYNLSVLSKLSWMSRQLRSYEDMQSIQLWANSMHLVKNLLITSSVENTVFPSHETNSWETISGLSSPSPTSNTPRSKLNCPTGLSTTYAYVCQRGSQKHQEFLKTGLHTTSVSHNNLRCERSQPHAKAALTTTAPLASFP